MSQTEKSTTKPRLSAVNKSKIENLPDEASAQAGPKSKIHDEWIAVLDFGSQYTQLIARRIREQHVYSEIVPWTLSAAELKRRRPAGIIFSGGPASVFDHNSPICDEGVLKSGIPVLGICYGMQLIAKILGGEVKPGRSREYGAAQLIIKRLDIFRQERIRLQRTKMRGSRPARSATHSVAGGVPRLHVAAPLSWGGRKIAKGLIKSGQDLFRGLPHKIKVWMSHGDQVEKNPPGFKALASTSTCPVAAMADPAKNIYGIQFHPEVVHTPQGTDILRNFIFSICKCKGSWAMAKFVQESVQTIRKTVGRGQVVCGLSGGVDSSVVAMLVHRAIGPQLHCIFVDNGLLRAGEVEQVEKTFRRHLGLDLRVVRAASMFLSDLKGVTEPETKRKIIGKRFVEVFSAEARKIGNVKYLAQGTLYPDVIESRSPFGGPSATIKTHHNVGGLPPDLKFKLIEPLRELFKDEARAVGHELGLPDEIIHRQPFPGPGLAVRIIGEVTAERVALLQNADMIAQQEIEKFEKARDIWQAFIVLLPVKSVGVMGDGRTYENVCVLRAVTSQDGMTADWAHLPPAVLERISNRIINEVKGINRVVYDISSKPPATIEWE